MKKKMKLTLYIAVVLICMVGCVGYKRMRMKLND